jgi:hypothetical protein
MVRNRFRIGLASIVVTMLFTAMAAALPAAAAESLTAIDVLLLPDGTMIEHAKAANARLRENYPAGFALDATHHPHVTLLQRYVRTKDLEAVYAAVERVLNAERPAGWGLDASGYYYLNFNNMGLAGIVVRPAPELQRLQQEIIAAVAPYTEPNGTSAAYVTTPDSPEVNAPTLQYVNTFIPERIGKNFNPHVTVGVGQLDFVERMKASPFERFKFKVAGAAVFHLGNFGTAQKELWAWESPTTLAARLAANATTADDPLPSWNDHASKQAILEFVKKVTTEGGPDFVPPHERIATFDNDGTLWCEQPMYTQVVFAVDRIKSLAPEHPEWKDEEPYKSILAGDTKAAFEGGEKADMKIMMSSHANLTTDEFTTIVVDWIKTAKHPRFDRLYTQLAYQPMLEVLAYLRANGFTAFVVSGGGIDFMRPWAPRVYGIPPERVVGSSIKVRYEMREGKPVLFRLPEVDFIDDGPGKPTGIYRFIGRRPIIAFGNSDGDLEMLQWTTMTDGPRLGMIVHHTDAVREYAYDRDSFVGRLDKALDQTPERGWVLIDMKNDWRTVFPE